MPRALRDLRLDRLWVIHAGRERYFLGERVDAVPLAKLHRELLR